LIVYQHAREVAKLVFALSSPFPREEVFALTDQGRRSSRSIGAQIAEAWAKRRYPNHFITKLTDADGEQCETQHWIETAIDCGYISLQEARDVLGRLAQIGRMLQSMVDRADAFCGEDHVRLREDRGTYGSLEEFFAPSSLNTEN